jgi:hypothetical protein
MNKDTKKYNEKIAKFVGGYTEPCRDLNANKWAFKDSKNPFKKIFGGRLVVCQLDFHKDLNWLIPVLEFIEMRGCIVEMWFNLNICTCRICSINGKNDKAFNIIHDNSTGGKQIDAIYNAVCEYLDYTKFKNKKHIL